MEKTLSKRLHSLDILRGFDLFCLTVFGPILWSIQSVINSPWYDSILTQFSHKSWEGFAFWDLIMPLFMFMAGVSMPFAFSKYTNGNSYNKKNLYLRILKRVVVLWILGMVCQGNLLAFEINNLRLFSNTLQAIAIGYLGTAILFLNFKRKAQIIICSLLLVGYWAIMQFVGNADYAQTSNLAEVIDSSVLGRFRDGVSYDQNGTWQFSPDYHYTWVLSSMNFIVTVALGMFTGTIIKSNKSEMQKVKTMAIFAVSLIAAGWLWDFQMPVIKTIWTSSMTLVSGGYCVALMCLFYYVIDVKGHTKYVEWLKIYGMNSIAAYVMSNVIRIGCVSTSLLYGTEQFLGELYPTLLKLASCTIFFLILLLMYKHKIFLKA
ncbi:MAG: heparan-alpha-glucosaminide N-acetyltransferase domain-containing protein [Rikenellaceae bacterium]